MILRCKGPRRRCGPGRMSRGTPRRYGRHLVGVVVFPRCPLHPLLVWCRSMQPSLGYVVELFTDSLSPLIYSFKSEQGKTLIYGIIFFTEFDGHSFLGFLVVDLGQKMAKSLSASSCFLLICKVPISMARVYNISLLKSSSMFPISPLMDELEENILAMG